MFTRLIAFAICTFAFVSTTHADFSAYKCEGPTRGPVTVIKNKGACEGFKTASGIVKFPRVASGELFVSTDARTVVMIEDYLPAQVLKDGTTVEALYNPEPLVASPSCRTERLFPINLGSVVFNVVHDPCVLTVYRDGKAVAGYDLARLVKNLAGVQHSISHIRWVASLPTTIDGDRFTLTTITGRRIVFDTRDGRILQEADLPRP